MFCEYKYKCEAGHKEEGGTKRDEGGEEEKRHRFSAVELAKALHNTKIFRLINIYRVFFFTGPTQKSSKNGTGPPQYRNMT